ncbi:MAG: C4-type zinc ribbon domain-containing protein [Verrucomicrobiota bacterium]|nr:C4-type zinc ribbon domain-containing protein [Limisphaera sp.]MDW8380943.1 C4-type zinc ribbon domain-containing protein [Verrucomicrobiota bacterium]
MLESLEKLLILQDRDHHLRRVREELAQLEPEREALRQRLQSAQAALEQVRQRLRQLENERRQLELEVASKQQLIDRYTHQQMQTRKNEEYQALSLEIERLKAAIRQIEDRELDLMEQAELGQKEMATVQDTLRHTENWVREQQTLLQQREQNLRLEYQKLSAERHQLANDLEPSLRQRYERLLKSRGGNVVVGIAHGVCGGCHMRLPPQVVVDCRSDQEIVTCPNCGRILYYKREMDMEVVD